MWVAKDLNEAFANVFFVKESRKANKQGVFHKGRFIRGWFETRKGEMCKYLNNLVNLHTWFIVKR